MGESESHARACAIATFLELKPVRFFLTIGQRLRHEARDLLELVLLPGLAAVLPWRWCFGLFKWIARKPFLYREAVGRALAEARERGWAGDEGDWLARRRLVTLIDHADFYLARTRSDAWLRRYVDVDGNWGETGRAALQLTFHWGAGMWALRHAYASGARTHMLVAPMRDAQFAGRTVLRRYILARTATIALALRRPVIDVSGSMRPLLRILQADEQIMAVIDVPADQVSSSQPVSLLGAQAHVPRVLPRLAVERQLPVLVYLSGINLDNGRRFLRLVRLGIYSDVDSLVADIFLQLDAAIQESPPSWHLWSEAPRFFR